jgi:hypothetical protein
MWTTKQGNRLRLLRSSAPRVLRQLSQLTRRKRQFSGRSPWQTLGSLDDVIDRAQAAGNLRHRRCGCEFVVFASSLGGVRVYIITRELPAGHAIVSIQARRRR